MRCGALFAYGFNDARTIKRIKSIKSVFCAHLSAAIFIGRMKEAARQKKLRTCKQHLLALTDAIKILTPQVNAPAVDKRVLKMRRKN